MSVCSVYLIFVLVLVSVAAKIQSISKTVGGTKENAAPYMAALFYHDDYICGAAIIHQNFVLTAGHCFEDADATDVRVLVGTNSLKNGTDFRLVIEAILHERWEFKDISVFSCFHFLYFTATVFLTCHTTTSHSFESTKTLNLARKFSRSIFLRWKSLTMLFWLWQALNELQQPTGKFLTLY